MGMDNMDANRLEAVVQEVVEARSVVSESPQVIRVLPGLPHPSEVHIPLPALDGAYLIVTRGPSLEHESIYAWLQPVGRGGCTALMTFEALLVDCSIEDEGFGGDPVVRIGSASFRVDHVYALQLTSRLRFASADD